MTVHAFTSCTYSYLNRARVLASTLKAHHPDWVLWVVVTDRPPEDFDHDWLDDQFDRVLFAADLIGEDFETWIFGHNIVEACTAVKGPATVRILEEADCTELLYFDPDIALINSMQPAVDRLQNASIILTPHQVLPEPRVSVQAIQDNELTSMTHGVFNLGFIGLRNDQTGREFAQWWNDRLLDWCYDQKERGLFVDQKWCDLIPCYFDRVEVVRDPGYNVASWNLSHRIIRFDDNGQIVVNGSPLRFYHFTKLGAVGDLMTQRYARDNSEVYEIWLWYKTMISKFTDPGIPDGYWYYSTFDNLKEIPQAARRLYRSRRDLQETFKHPSQVADGFYDWLSGETDILHVPGG